MDPPENYPIIAVSTGLRWLTEGVAWKRGWDFVYCVAAAFLPQKSDSLLKMENYSTYLLFFDRGVVLVDHVRSRDCTHSIVRYCAGIDEWFGMKIYFRIDKEIRPLHNNIFFQRRQCRAVTLP